MIATVLVGIATRNRAEILPKALASVFAQNYPTFQIEVIDDGSTDATAELVGHFPEILWTRWKDSHGLMLARNHLMANQVASYFVSLDDDAWFLAGDEISVAVDYLERHSEVAAVAFDILSPDRPQSQPRTEPAPAALFIGCGHVLRLDTVRQVGGYEPVPGNYGGEEKDLCLRLLDAGFRIVKLPGVHVWHDKSPLSRNAAAQYCSVVCNDFVMALRRVPVLLLPAALAVKVYRHATYSLKYGQVHPCLQGLVWFARSIPTTLRLRRPVRASTLRTFMRLSRS
jgi:GT2 family glycosyltransferase